MSNFNIGAISSPFGYSGSQDRCPTLQGLGIPNEIIKKGPDAVKQYASEHSIDLSVIQAQPKPPVSPISPAKNTQRKEIVNTLLSLGIPSSVISQGRAAVIAYAQANGITLPIPPQNGSRLNIQG